MFTLTQVLIPLALLASVVIGLPLTEYESQRKDFPFNAFRINENDRIFGGHEAMIGQFPYQVSLRLKENNRHFCGGSIVSNRFVLTAGHCLKKLSDEFVVVAGAHKNEGKDGKVYGVNQFVVHENYYLNFTATNATLINDIALIQTATTIEFNNLVASIALHSGFISEGARVVSSGWGLTNDIITNLKYVHLNTLTNSVCRVQFKNITDQIPPVHDFSNLCAFSGEGGHGVCNGDSGGPLVFENQLIGITSWTIPCAKGVPDGFTRISTYVNWVKTTIRSLQS